ncbi:MAG: hypothetical protein CFH34_01091 [Alphaproteobacteria bacterium MarineAlpha9_Bin4]|nr:hypothetical protein [Pelagibacterales bacterium]PPR26194.1 MAG: hypothetical protein CFH34_01091 [Alphaproteobacteria bacterium MarineAlpha9_Bin4]
MKLYHYIGLVLILFLINSCSIFNTPKHSIKKENQIKKNVVSATKCPNYYIPNDTRYLKDKNNEKLIKIFSIKLKCNLVKDEQKTSSNKVIIKHTIYFQILTNKLKLDPSNTKIFVGLVDEEKNKVKIKILSKVLPAPVIKVNEKIFFKNSKSFRINLDQKSNRLVFYYGFQN